MKCTWIKPDWPAPAQVRAASTMRAGGGSKGPFASLNLGMHVGDDYQDVSANRLQIMRDLELPSPPQWLTQVHGNHTVKAGDSEAPEADAAFTRTPGIVCAVMTADCLPVLLCTPDGSSVAAIHAGWRGLASGVIESAIQAIGTTDVMVWLGPAIGPAAFEVGPEVLESFARLDTAHAHAFRPAGQARFMADIYQLARLTLVRAGVRPDAIHGGRWCTYHQPADFFSYRRDRVTGRMATLIWLANA